MLKKVNLTHLIGSTYFFYSVLLINITLLCLTRFYPSMDGPSHLYNSNVLNQLIGGNKILGEFYSINPVPIPNWTGHIILSFLHVFFSAWMAEKIFLILYISGMAFSFRYLIKVLSPENIPLSLLIFPFIYSFLFHLGFYNYSLSFILFFTTLAYWIQNQSTLKVFKYLLIFILITTTYFANVLTYAFLGFTMGLFILYFAYEKYTQSRNFSLTIKFASNKILWLFLLALPSLIFLLIFYTQVRFFPGTQSYSDKELLKWINDVRPLIVYDYVGEEIITEHFLHILLIILASGFLLKKITKANDHNIFTKGDIITIPLLLCLLLLFITPNGSGAGMMSDRYCLLLFILGLIWIASRSIPNKFNILIVCLIVMLHLGLLFKHLNGTIKRLDSDAIAINKVESFINANSIVLPINLSENWLEPHFSNYLGVDKPMIILENYEASVGWFPIKWNEKSLPNILLGERKSISCIEWASNPNSKNIRQIDNVLIYGNTVRIDDMNWKELKEILLSDFKLKYSSENNYVKLYERLR
jgi:hypothetical protein